MHGSTAGANRETDPLLLLPLPAAIPAAMRLLLRCRMQRPQMSCCRYLRGIAAAAQLSHPARMLRYFLSARIHRNAAAALLHSRSHVSIA
jgi:hypothetical protein